MHHRKNMRKQKNRKLSRKELQSNENRGNLYFLGDRVEYTICIIGLGGGRPWSL